MKVVVFCFLVFASVTSLNLTEEVLAKMAKIHNDCRIKTGADEVVVRRAMVGDIIEDSKLKDHTFCIALTLGWQDDAGEYQMDKIKESIHMFLPDPAQAEIFLSKCVMEKDSPAQGAFDMFKCLFDVGKS